MSIYLDLLNCRFGETFIHKGKVLNRELFNMLCQKLQEKTGVETKVDIYDRLTCYLKRKSKMSMSTAMSC